MSEADPQTLATTINAELDAQAEETDLQDFTDQGVLTQTEADDLQNAGLTTRRDLAQADPETVVNERIAAGSTLTEAKVSRVRSLVKPGVTLVERSDAKQIIAAAGNHLPVGFSLASKPLTRHTERKQETGSAQAKVRSLEEASGSVGEPLAATRSNLDADDPKAVYISDIGRNETDPVVTGLPVLEDVGYDQVPRKETDPDAGHEALPVDESGNVVPPAVPVERDLQMPVDQLVANKLARGVPVRLIGPRGSGKNYLMKYLCYKTNRGYRSIDVDKATMPEDLFGTLSPDEDGVIEPRNGEVKQGLLNGDTVVINEFPVMKAGAAIALHQLLNENRLVIKHHGEEIAPHPAAQVVITMNPPTREYRDSEPMNAATRGRFRSFWMGYPDAIATEVDTLRKQLNTEYGIINRATMKSIVEFAHRTRENERWPTLSTRNLTIVCEHIQDGASPAAALKNVVRTNAEQNQNIQDPFETINTII